MPSLARRSRELDSEDDEQGSRAATPHSTAPNDSKRARPSRPGHGAVSADNSSWNVALKMARRERRERSTTLEGEVKTGSEHQPGAIVRVKLTNFVTYSSAEFFPGANLNMVIGPNGTGKSTLVCAICLGLGWGTQHLGRAKDVSEFVKHGCREAIIEIELKKRPKMGRNPVITRLIKREGNKSSYTLNGVSTTNKAVMDLARSFSIQIDNLCQFLPQDKVVEFAAMTPVELLRSTQQAAADPEMLEWHDSLIKIRRAQKELIQVCRGDREQLKSLMHRQEMQRGDVERLKQRVVIQQRLQWLEKCRPIPKYTEAKKKHEEAKARQRQLASDLVQLKREVEPALRRVNQKQAYTAHVQELKQVRLKSVADGEEKCTKIEKKIDDLEDKLKDCDSRTEAERKSIAPKKIEITQIQSSITSIKNQMEDEPAEMDLRKVNQQVENLVRKRREMEGKLSDEHETRETLREQGKQRKAKIQAIEKRLGNLETVAGQQESKLERSSPDTYKAWQWIQNHRDEFEMDVFGPPMIECSLKDPRAANAVESLLQRNDFRIITVQCKADFIKLQQKLFKDMKLHQLSLRQCSNNSLDEYRSPMSTEELRALGLQSWAIDHFNGPPTVLAMLCEDRRLHLTAIATEDVSSEQYDRISRTPIQSFVAGKTSYQFIRRAEYGAGGTSSRTREVRNAQYWTDAKTVDTSTKERLTREMNEAKQEMEEISVQFRAAHEKVGELKRGLEQQQEEIDALKREKDDHQRAVMTFRQLPARLQQLEEKLASVRENQAGLKQRIDGIKAERDQYLAEEAEMVVKLAETVCELQGSHEEALKMEVVHIEAMSDSETMQERNQAVLDMLKTKVAEEKQAKELSKALLGQALGLLAETRKVSSESDALEAQGDNLFKNFLDEFSRANFSVDGLEAEIDSERAKLTLSEHQGVGDVVKEFEDRQKKIEKLKQSIAKAEEDLDDYKAGIAEVRGSWEPELDQLVAKISDAFADSFRRIGCAGHVEVYKPGSNEDESGDVNGEGTSDGLNFAEWALHISVKFRENEPLSLLDSHRQSGGERAVSTIFYLMALQSLSRAPFRVVDEINQGMDPRNERAVHARMVDLACDRRAEGRDGDESDDSDDEEEGGVGGGQYFLITPKLLPGLKYKRKMTILLIVSGEAVPSSSEASAGKKVDFGKLVQQARDFGWDSASMGGASSQRSGSSGREADLDIARGSALARQGNGYVNEVGA